MASIAAMGTSAQAQSAGHFRPFEAITIVRSMGLHPLSPPVRRGPTFVVLAADPYGAEVRVVIDARYGGVLSATPAAGMPPASPTPRFVRRYEAYPPPYGAYRPMPRYEPGDDEFDDGDMGLEDISAQPPRVIQAPREKQPRAAALMPAKPPVPRPRPQAAAVSEVKPAPANAIPVPAQNTEAKPPLAATRPASEIPVNPLE
jgi:hypothetical protein